MLYEPTNIIPSTMTQTGTVAATTDNVNIQWQVNGNSAMTMFQIDVMQNNADSTFVYSTGVVTENPTVAQGYSLPFYGKDRFGDYVQFVYQPNQTWALWSGNAISNGNNYKFRITQFFQENGTACKVQITSNLSAGTTYYFTYAVNGTMKYVSFTVANAAYFVSGNTIYFNFSHNTGWVATSGTNSRAITDITFSVSETQPSGTQLSGAEAVSSGDMFYNQFFTAQNSASSFITRTEPTLTITPLTETPVASATQNFTATYSQAQGDSINTVRWQLYNADDMSTPIDDTGEISTSILSYEYNGLFDGQSYSVVCTVTAESGVTVSSTLDFSVQYEQGTYTGDFTAQSLCREDANLLKWDSTENIPGVDNPSGSATVSNGQLLLPANSTVTWSQKSDESGELQPLNFPQPWTAVWNGEIDQLSAGFDSQVTGITKTVNYLSSIKVKSVYDWQEVSEIEKNGEPIGASGCTFLPDGTTAVLWGSYQEGGANVFTVTETGATFVKALNDADGSIGQNIFAAPISPNGNLMVLFGGTLSSYCSLYSVSDSEINFVNSFLTGIVGRCATFSQSGDQIVFGGRYSSFASAAICNVSGTEITGRTKITLQNESLDDDWVYTASFSPDGSLLFLGGNISGKGQLFSVDGTNVTYKMTLPSGDSTQFSNNITASAFSPDGKYLIVGEGDTNQNGSVSVYLIFNNIPIFQYKLTGADGSVITAREANIRFSQTGNTLVVGNRIYSWVNDEAIYKTSVGYANNYINPGGNILVSSIDTLLLPALRGATRLYNLPIISINNFVLASAQKDNLIVLGGVFDNFASVFSVNGTEVTYVGDIMKSGAALSGATNAIAFSPDGSLLAVGGAFSGYASVFSVSGTEVTYVADIAKSGSALDGVVEAISFNQQGNAIILGGDFNGKTSLFKIGRAHV